MNVLSVLSEPKLNTPNKLFQNINTQLWSQLVSCNIRQKQHRDYSSATFQATYFYKMPSSVLAARFIASVELYFNNEKLALSEKEKNKTENSLKRSLVNITIEMKTLDSFYNHIKNEWLSMCQIYKLVLEISEASAKCPELNSKIETKCVNLKKFIVYYGPKL